MDTDELKNAAEELKRRYEANKLLYYKPCCRVHSRWENEKPVIFCPVVPCPESKHALFHKSEKRIRVVYGGNRCIDGDTMIEDPVYGDKRRVKDIDSDFHVWAWDGKELVVAKAEKPFVKGIDDLYEVKLSNGEAFICTMAHQVLTPEGYKKVCDLAPGAKLVQPREVCLDVLSKSHDQRSFYGPQVSILESDRSTHVLSGPSSSQTVPGSLFGYLAYFRSYDEQLRLAASSGPNVSPSRGDVPSRSALSFFPFSSQTDGSENKSGYSHSFEQADHLSIQDGQAQNEAPSFDTLSRSAYKLYRSVSGSLPIALRSTLAFVLPRSIAESGQQANQLSDDISLDPPFLEVIKISPKKRDVYYDFTVANFHNYYLAGAIHHNSSKSYTGIAELLMMACLKNHPYRGHKNPGSGTGTGRFRIYSSDFAIIEKLFLPLIRDLIPMGALAGKGDTKGERFEDSYDEKYHMLHLKSGILDFMSYDQEQSKSESVELDAAMADEEMPENIYSATLARLISRNGKFWMTVTPLYGMSWGMQFLENLDPQVEVFRWEIFDNPYISRQSIDDFEKSITNPLEKEARIYGRFMEFQGLVYKELQNQVHLLGSDKPKPGYPVVFALDPHPRRPSAMAWAFVTPKGDVVFFDEMEVGGTAKEIVRAIREREYTHGIQPSLRLIDPAARAQGSNISFETDTLREFEQAGMGFTMADNAEAGYNIAHEYLSYDASRPMDSMNRPRCYFTKDVPKTWYSMTHLMWDEWAFRRQKHWKEKKERVRDYQKDFSDVVRYVLAERPTFRNLKFASAGVPTGNWQNAANFERDTMVRDMFIRNVAA